MTSVGSLEFWIAFNAVVVVLLGLDLLVVNKEAHEVRLREAAVWSVFWIALALGFNAFIYFRIGPKAGLEFLAGYLLEKSLSVDNLFVFLLILGHFKVPKASQHRVLFWGVFGALVLRVLFILAGAALVSRFNWVLYIFGAFLVYTAIKLVRGGDDDGDDIENNRVLALVRRVVPMTERYEGAHLFVKRGGRWVATPLLAVLAVIETSDVMFAVDSIPAVFGVTQDPFLVYTSNICAILGLRALFFLVLGVLQVLRYLKYGLAVVLAFIGVKMLIVSWVHIPIGLSLGVIAGVLTVTVVASVLADRRDRRQEAAAKEETGSA